MMRFNARVTMACIGFMTLSPVLSTGLTLAEDQKPKAKPQAKAVTPKAAAKFRTAETTSKSAACFGVAPQIDKLVPDEGQPGTQVTIKGVEFGTPECLRSVSFGPGHASTFTMKDESTIVTTVPTGGRKGLVMLTVTTASGEHSKTFMVK
ncbi:MAG: IPT/TIG domain-containing protein [Nitrospira sp.]